MCHQGSLEEIQEYLNGMGEMVYSADVEIQCGNVLDNAIEAVEDLESDKSWVRFDISVQGKMLFFRFSNPIKEDAVAVIIGKTTKQESMYHGFGLQKIQYAVEKYHGQMLPEIENNGGAEFVLSIVVGEE